MKLTLDRMCISTGKLCPSCQDRFDLGEISNIDIEVGQALLATAKSQRFLSNITLLNIVTTDNSIILMTKKGDKEKIERSGDHFLKRISKLDDREIIILEKTKNAKALVEMLIGSDNVLTTSTVLLPPFSDKELKIQIKKDLKDGLGIKQTEMSKITDAFLGMKAHYSFV